MEDIIKKLLSTNTENEVFELKEASSQFDINKLGKYFSALSNEANLKGQTVAWIIFGITDSKVIKGTNISDKQLNAYKLEIASNTSPKIGFREIHEVVIDGKRLLLLEIPAAPKGMPVSWKGHFYGRDGESLGPLHLDEIERIRLQGNSLDWSSQIVSGATLEDLSPEAIIVARFRFIVKNPNLEETVKSWNDVTFLNKAKLTINGQITNTAILLLGKPESEHFINPATPKISWILKDRDNLEKDYQHFTCPLLIEVEQVFSKIRNIKYRYLKDGTLFPEEVDQFDPYIIREALNNCIAHQDYSLGGKISVVEREDGILTFSNMGQFIPPSVEWVIAADAPESKYRNTFLTSAMVNLNMIDTIGSGIKRMFVIQKDKYFPLPDYDISNNKVTVSITGKVVDVNYARKLAQISSLSLSDIIVLDKIVKKKTISDLEIEGMKSRGLIEGRKPNYHISSKLAKGTGQQKDYMQLKGIEDDYIMKQIKDYLKKFGSAGRNEFEELLMDKLPQVLSYKQKKNKVKNILQKLKKEGEINTGDDRRWHLVSKAK